MKVTGKEALIKGSFSPEQAKEIVNTLFRSKIQMHSLSSFSSLIQTGRDSHPDVNRRKELTESLERIVKAINEMADSGMNVKLSCDVKMEFVAPNKTKK